LCLSLAFFLTACRTPSGMPAVNLAEPGWALRQGQAVWRSGTGKPDIAGELLLATRGDRAVLQLSKTPLPFVTVQTSGAQWHIEFVPQRRTFHGVGEASVRLSWVHLARALNGVNPPALLVFQYSAQQGFILENPQSGEMISGFLNP
jgi:hypothetical protein